MLKLSKEKRDQLILVSVGTLAVVVGLWYWVIGAQETVLAQTIKKKSSAVSKLTKGQLYVKNSSVIQSNLVVVAERLRSLEEAMPSGDMYIWMFNTLDTFKLAHSVNILDIQREKLAKFELMPDFPYTNSAVFRVKVEAPYHDFGKFLADFENKYPHIIVNNMDLAVHDIKDALSPEKLSIEFDVVALVKPLSSP